MSTTTTSSPAQTEGEAKFQAERERVAKALRKYADKRREDHQAITKARAEAVAMACGYTELDAMGEPVLVDEGLYSYEDVLNWIARALDFGAASPRMGGDTIERVYRGELVPNAIFRDVIERRVAAGTASLQTVAKLAGLVRADGKGDDRNFERLLGMQPTPGRADYPPTLRIFVSHDQALAIAAALELDPNDCGL